MTAVIVKLTVTEEANPVGVTVIEVPVPDVGVAPLIFQLKLGLVVLMAIAVSVALAGLIKPPLFL